MISGSTYESHPKKINMMKKMSLLSCIFRSRGDLSKEVKKIEGGEEGPCTSYSHREEGTKQEEHLELEIVSEYLAEYQAKPRAFKETLALPQFIQLKEEKRPHSYGMMRGNRFLLSTFDGSLTCATEVWVKKL